MSKNNKKGFVCVCYSGVWTFNCVLFSAFAFHFENPPLIPVPEQFPPSAPFFGFSELRNPEHFFLFSSGRLTELQPVRENNQLP